MENDIELECSVCKRKFFRKAKEVRRNAKLNRKIYCGNSCSAKDKIELRNNWNNPILVQEYLKPNWGRKRDTYSPFRFYLARARAKHKEMNLSPQYLKELWEKQNGLCPYTGLKMFLPETQKEHQAENNTPYRASLDRIDSSKGYIEGNVEFVCLGVNLAKNVFSKEVMLEFFSKINV